MPDGPAPITSTLNRFFRGALLSPCSIVVECLRELDIDLLLVYYCLLVCTCVMRDKLIKCTSLRALASVVQWLLWERGKLETLTDA